MYNTHTKFRNPNMVLQQLSLLVDLRKDKEAEELIPKLKRLPNADLKKLLMIEKELARRLQR